MTLQRNSTTGALLKHSSTGELMHECCCGCPPGSCSSCSDRYSITMNVTWADFITPWDKFMCFSESGYIEVDVPVDELPTEFTTSAIWSYNQRLACFSCSWTGTPLIVTVPTSVGVITLTVSLSISTDPMFCSETCFAITPSFNMSLAYVPPDPTPTAPGATPTPTPTSSDIICSLFLFSWNVLCITSEFPENRCPAGSYTLSGGTSTATVTSDPYLLCSTKTCPSSESCSETCYTLSVTMNGYTGYWCVAGLASDTWSLDLTRIADCTWRGTIYGTGYNPSNAVITLSCSCGYWVLYVDSYSSSGGSGSPLCYAKLAFAVCVEDGIPGTYIPIGAGGQYGLTYAFASWPFGWDVVISAGCD